MLAQGKNIILVRKYFIDYAENLYYLEVYVGIRGGLYHQILYKDNVKLIDEGYGNMEWNPPSFKLNGIEIPEEDYVEISDDLLMYFNDYFIWIETYNPVGPKEFNRGFNFYGLTAIRDENLAIFGKLIGSLMNLFEHAPENITLKGNFCLGFPPGVEPSSDYNPQRGYYRQIKIEKDELLKLFGDLKNITDRAIKNNGYLLHFGI